MAKDHFRLFNKRRVLFSAPKANMTKEIVELHAEGLSTEEISEELGLALQRVVTVVNKLRRKNKDK